MKKEPSKKKQKESAKDKFRLIKNENYREPRKPKPPIRITVDDLPPVA
jgi:hypothetical protein